MKQKSLIENFFPSFFMPQKKMYEISKKKSNFACPIVVGGSVHRALSNNGHKIHLSSLYSMCLVEEFLFWTFVPVFEKQ